MAVSVDRVVLHLILANWPEACDYRRGLIYDCVRFKDDSGAAYYYIGPSCSANGRSTTCRSQFLDWAWRAQIGDRITITAKLEDNAIIHPIILK